VIPLGILLGYVQKSNTDCVALQMRILGHPFGTTVQQLLSVKFQNSSLAIIICNFWVVP
jgi:hypothetical protein